MLGCYDMSFCGVHRLSGALEFSMVRFFGTLEQKVTFVRNFNAIMYGGVF